MNDTPKKPLSEQEAFLAYLDNPDNEDARDGAAELVAMMEAVEDIDVPDPGQDYWNQFNHRLQQRLEQEPRKRFTFQWRQFFGQWQAAFAFAGIVLLGMLVWRPLAPHENPHRNGMEWSQMSEQDLAMIGQLYNDDYLDENLSELADNDWSQLLDGLGEEGGLFDGDSDLPLDEDFDSEAFKSLWNAEG